MLERWYTLQRALLLPNRPSSMVSFPTSHEVNMELENVNICLHCTNLVKFEVGANKPPLSSTHHSPFGALLTSSKTCRLCHAIASLWEFGDDDLTRFSSEENPPNNTRKAFTGNFTVKAAASTCSGVCWTFVEVDFKSNNTPLCILCDFTLVTCPERCKRSFLIWRSRSMARR